MHKKRPSALGLDDLLPTEGQGREEMIQFYAWDFDDAWAAEEAWRAKYGPDIRGRGPFSRWIGAQELKECYEIYKTGNARAILDALFLCALNSLPIPRWCETAYLAALRKVQQYRVKNWDDVFGRPHAKGTHLETKFKEREFGWRIYQEVQQIKKDDSSVAIDGFLFEQIGLKNGIGGKTYTEKLYYQEKKRRNLIIPTKK